MKSPSSRFTAIVLAGERGAGDPLPEHAGASCKALVEIEGIPMLHRVVEALQTSTIVDTTWLSGPSKTDMIADGELLDWIDQGKIHWQNPGPTPSTSAYQLMEKVDKGIPFLVTTADHPLLSGSLVDEFCRQSLDTHADITIGLAPYPLVQKSFPDMKKTLLRFRDGHYCGCNLFTFLTPKGLGAAHLWRTVEDERKKPFKLLRILGWRFVLRYRLGLLSLDEALLKLSDILGLRVGAITLHRGEAAVDVDSVADYQLMQARFKNEG